MQELRKSDLKKMHTNLPMRSSSPIDNNTFVVKTLPADLDISNDFLLQTGDSTRSLLTPLYASNSISYDVEESEKDETGEKIEHVRKIQNSKVKQTEYDSNHSSYSENKLSVNSSQRKAPSGEILPSKSSVSSSKPSISEGKKTSSWKKSTSSKSTLKSSSTSFSSTSSSSSSRSSSPSRLSTTQSPSKITDLKYKSWENWLLEKALLDLQNMKMKKEVKRRQNLEKKKAEEEKHNKELLSQENREEWIKNKTFHSEKRKNERAAQIEFEKLKKQQEADLIDKKAKERYSEWYQESLEKQKEKRRNSKIEQEVRQTEKLNKKLASEEAYKEWLKKSKKKRQTRSTHGYSGGSLFSYYDMVSTPPPSFVNPVPWVANLVQNNNNNEKTGTAFSSPPLLWKEVREREHHVASRSSLKQKRIISKHSCIT